MEEAVKQNYLELVQFIHKIFLDKEGVPGWDLAAGETWAKQEIFITL